MNFLKRKKDSYENDIEKGMQQMIVMNSEKSQKSWNVSNNLI
jgi:hypothetical protein